MFDAVHSPDIAAQVAGAGLQVVGHPAGLLDIWIEPAGTLLHARIIAAALGTLVLHRNPVIGGPIDADPVWIGWDGAIA
ncbi:hypothetical protein [Niveispirillum fermenti]|uniref:hypothetical protein n=1 Tax=Niveispirillum fermenti TaxID=1233113 RepID=UPI003A888F74